MVGDYHDLADIVPQVRGNRVFETNARAAGPDGTTTGVCDEASWTWRCVRAAAWIAGARFVSSWRGTAVSESHRELPRWSISSTSMASTEAAWPPKSESEPRRYSATFSGLQRRAVGVIRPFAPTC